MFWFDQVADITPELAAKAKTMAMVKEAGMWTSYVMAAVGSLLLLIGIMLAVRNIDDLDDLDEDDEAPILNARQVVEDEGTTSQPPSEGSDKTTNDERE